jgi:hypothetical protein
MSRLLVRQFVVSMEQGKVDTLSNDAANSQSLVPDGYVSLVVRIWVGDSGKLIRGTIEDVHTGAQLAIDLSKFAALLRASLAHTPGHMPDVQKEEAEETISELLGRILGEAPLDTDADDTEDHAPDPRNGGEEST